MSTSAENASGMSLEPTFEPTPQKLESERVLERRQELLKVLEGREIDFKESKDAADQLFLDSRNDAEKTFDRAMLADKASDAVQAFGLLAGLATGGLDPTAAAMEGGEMALEEGAESKAKDTLKDDKKRAHNRRLDEDNSLSM